MFRSTYTTAMKVFTATTLCAVSATSTLQSRYYVKVQTYDLHSGAEPKIGEYYDSTGLDLGDWWFASIVKWDGKLNCAVAKTVSKGKLINLSFGSGLTKISVDLENDLNIHTGADDELKFDANIRNEGRHLFTLKHYHKVFKKEKFITTLKKSLEKIVLERTEEVATDSDGDSENGRSDTGNMSGNDTASTASQQAGTPSPQDEEDDNDSTGSDSEEASNSSQVTEVTTWSPETPVDETQDSKPQPANYLAKQLAEAEARSSSEPTKVTKAQTDDLSGPQDVLEQSSQKKHGPEDSESAVDSDEWSSTIDTKIYISGGEICGDLEYTTGLTEVMFEVKSKTVKYLIITTELKTKLLEMAKTQIIDQYGECAFAASTEFDIYRQYSFEKKVTKVTRSCLGGVWPGDKIEMRLKTLIK